MSVKEGYLDVKQSGGPLPKRWTKCYVMLKADGIYYFKEKKSKTPLDTLLWAKVQSVEAIGKDDENVFQVKTPTSVTLHVCASADDKRSWLSLINKMRSPGGVPMESADGDSAADNRQRPSISSSSSDQEPKKENNTNVREVKTSKEIPKQQSEQIPVKVSSEERRQKKERLSKFETMDTKELEEMRRTLKRDFTLKTKKLIDEWLEEKLRILDAMKEKEIAEIEKKYQKQKEEVLDKHRQLLAKVTEPTKQSN
jgi:hypothetical protein